MNEALLREIRRWCRYAVEDLQQAQRLIQQEDAVPRHPAWLAQQAAEKAIKAVLIFLQIEFPRTHNLNILHDLIPGNWHVKQVKADLARLSEYAVEARYPGDLPDVSAYEARLAVEDATQLVTTVQADLNARIST